MLPQISVKKYCLESIILLLFIMCFSINSIAQNKVAKTGNNKYKTSRVFYGEASFYSGKFNGRLTASGEIYSQNKRTCACNVLPLGTWIKVTNVRNGKSVIVKVNDRLHPRMRRIVDLTKTDAIKLGYASAGVGRVKVEVIGKKKK